MASWSSPVTEEGGSTPEGDLAHFAVGAGPAGDRVPDLDLHRRRRLTDRVGVVVGGGRRQRGAVSGGLGHPVPHAEPGANPGKLLLEPFEELGRPYRASAGDPLQAREVVPAQIRPVQEPPQLGGHEGPGGRLVLDGEAKVGLLGPAARRRVDHGDAGPRRHRQGASEATDMEHGGGRDRAGAHRTGRSSSPRRGQGGQLGPSELGGQAELDVAPVRDHGPLGTPRRPAGEEDDVRSVLVYIDLRPGGAGSGHFQRGEILLEDHHRQGPSIEPFQPVQPAPVAQEQFGLGQLYGVGHLGAGPPAVEGHRDRSQRGSGPKSQDVLDAIGRHDCHPVALLNPELVAEGCARQPRPDRRPIRT